MITTRKPNEKELADLVRYVHERVMASEFAFDMDSDEAKEYEWGARERVRCARCITIFEHYPFKFSSYPQYRKLYEDKLILVIWDDDPNHCQIFLYGQQGVTLAVGDGM